MIDPWRDIEALTSRMQWRIDYRILMMKTSGAGNCDDDHAQWMVVSVGTYQHLMMVLEEKYGSTMMT